MTREHEAGEDVRPGGDGAGQEAERPGVIRDPFERRLGRGDQDQDAPEAVDHRRDGREEIDQRGDRSAPPLGQEHGRGQRDADRQRYRDDHGDRARHERAVDEGRRAEDGRGVHGGSGSTGCP